MPKTEVRIDKWLWAMRVFKTRSISTDACKKGRVSIGGAPAKPSRTFRVKALTESRLGARLVPEYLENITPKAQYDMLEMVRISGFVDRQKGLGRPTKREGRELAAFRQQSTEDFFLPFDDDFDDLCDDE